MRFKFLPEAREELLEAALFYEQMEPELGVRFQKELTDVVGRITSDPFLWRERPGGYRRVNLPIFPYYVAYFVRRELVIIAAVAHAKRKPNYWKQNGRHTR